VVRSGSVLYLGSTIGARFNCGHNVVIRERSSLGDGVSVWSNSVIDYGCKIASDVKIHCNCYIAQYTIIEDKAFLAPSVSVANDLYPSLEESKQKMRGPIIRRGAQIGVTNVAEAWSLLENGNRFHLHIAGGGPLRKEVEEFAKGRSDVTYHGFVSLERLAEIYRTADVFLYPSQCDNFALVVIEALASGAHVVISKTLEPVYREFVKEGYADVLRDTRPVTIRSKILEVSSRVGEFRKQRQRQFEFVKKNYDWSSITRELVNRMTECAEARHTPKRKAKRPWSG